MRVLLPFSFRITSTFASPTPFRHQLLHVTLPQLGRGKLPLFFPVCLPRLERSTAAARRGGMEWDRLPSPFRSISAYAARRMHAPFLGPALLSPPWHLRRLLREREGEHVYSAMRRGCCEAGVEGCISRVIQGGGCSMRYPFLASNPVGILITSLVSSCIITSPLCRHASPPISPPAQQTAKLGKKNPSPQSTPFFPCKFLPR